MKDPAFLFYDGDAARDVSHMNRLERGAYFDLIQAQRKFGGYTVEQARKILGKDFDEVWPALELILSKDGESFFIEWVRNSMRKRAEHAEKQRERIQKYWDEKKESELPTNNHGNTVVLPLVNENEIVNQNKIKKGKQKKDFDFSFVSLEFKDLFDRWVNYKRERKEMYKTQDSLETCYRNMIKLSGGSFAYATEIIDHSIGNNYQGMFPPKQQNQTKKVTHDTDY